MSVRSTNRNVNKGILQFFQLSMKVSGRYCLNNEHHISRITNYAWVRHLSFSTIHSVKFEMSQRLPIPIQHYTSKAKFFSAATKTLSKEVGDSNDKGSDIEPHLVSNYEVMAKTSGVIQDPHQLSALRSLDRLRHELINNRNCDSIATKKDEAASTVHSFFSKIFSNDSTDGQNSVSSQNIPKGVYLHGGVGCGKTFCMDQFFDSISRMDRPPRILAQKVHFNKFMLTSVHKQMHKFKMIDKIKDSEAVLRNVVDSIIEDGNIICFDEFQVTDVADALILRRLFTGLIEAGAVIVMTSNRPPQDLYLNGIQRDRFVPFIDLLIDRMEIVSMWESETDYRLVHGKNKARGVYFVGDKRNELESAFLELTKGDEKLKSMKLVTINSKRSLFVPTASAEHGVARFSFDDLCRNPLGAEDYLTIGDNFHTVFISDIPALTMKDINLVRRLILFVDSMYECHVKLIVHAATTPDGMFKVDLKNRTHDEVFAFDRTRSRLEEMGSVEYLKKRWLGGQT
mmetsp:Transcript_53353/g.62311  ORF Transcript_53353/g.62311 Transcript_53353/m.62311 type:complete len:512 (-) Transcript_53353:201-1736(-)